MANSTIEITDHSGIKDWLTPKGVITIPSFIGRALAAIVIMIGPTFSLASLAAIIDPSSTNGVVNATVGVVAVTSFLLGLWILLATFTKHYRTKGMSAPFFFALFTPVMPLMLVVTWIFSSKERRLYNEHLANQQAVLRKMAKQNRKTKSIDESLEPRYGRQSRTAKKQEPTFRDNDAPTVRRRR